MSTASVYNLARESKSILKRFRKASPSLSIELYPKHFRFKGQTGIFLYDSPMKAFLEYIRAQQIPYDLLPYLPSPQIPYYDGCLIVELIDHRPSANLSIHSSIPKLVPSDLNTTRSGDITEDVDMNNPPLASSAYQGGKGPHPVRIVLHPTPASLWSDICAISEDIGQGTWDDWDALQLEARIVAATAPPLYLGTSFYGTRIANAAIALTSPLAPPEAQQTESSTAAGSSSALEARKKAKSRLGPQRRDEMESQKSLYQIGELRKQGGFQPNFSRLTQIEAFRSHPAFNRPRPPVSETSPTHPGLPPPSGAYPHYNPRASIPSSISHPNPAHASSSTFDAPFSMSTSVDESYRRTRQPSVSSSVDEPHGSEPYTTSDKKKVKKKKKKGPASEQSEDITGREEPSTPAVVADLPKLKKGKKKATKAEEVVQTPASDAPTPSAASVSATKKGKNKKGANMSPENLPPKKKQKTMPNNGPAGSVSAVPLGPPPVPHYTQPHPPSSSPYFPTGSKTLPPTYAPPPLGQAGKTLPGVGVMPSSQQMQLLQQHFQNQSYLQQQPQQQQPQMGMIGGGGGYVGGSSAHGQAQGW